MEDMRPPQLALIDSLQGRPGGGFWGFDEKPDDALRILKRYYEVDFGMDAAAWLNYILENDHEFVELLHATYRHEHSIDTYKNTLLDIDNRDDVL